MRCDRRTCKDLGVAKTEEMYLELCGHQVRVSNPNKVYFPKAGITKKELVAYYVSVADGAVRGVRGRPMILKRYVNGVEQEPFFQKRVDKKRPEWIETAVFKFPSGRSAEEIVVNDVAQLVYVVNLGCVDLNPHAIRATHMENPDELRIDLDPVPGVAWAQIVDVARVVREVLDDYGLVGWPKTSGSRGAHIWVRIEPRWPFATVRKAGLALAREVEKRAPAIATAKWWKEERHGVFVDYNQNARDRTTASAYSVRPTPDARVSMPLTWDELFACNPLDFTLRTVPALFAERGDAHAAIDAHAGTIEKLLALADEQGPERPAKKQAKAKLPVITIGQAKQKADAIAGLERWKTKYPEVAARLAPEDVLVDTNRGRATAWYRIRINLKNVPDGERPVQEPLDPDYDPKTEYVGWVDGEGDT
jgi:DNA ligase D-like protein (predicted polymerase)